MVNKELKTKGYVREQEFFEDNDTKSIAFYSRLINFVEDVIDDAYCTTVYVGNIDSPAPWTARVVVEPIECKYDPFESIKLFSEEWGLDNVVMGRGMVEYTRLYGLVIRKYLGSLHYKMKSYAGKTFLSKREYYLAISFYGEAVVVEGEQERIRVPMVSQCFSAHTHPSTKAIPSIQDITTTMTIMLNRGVGHAIETVRDTLIIYRTTPLTEDDMALLRRLERMHDISRAIELLKKTSRIKVVHVV